MKVLAIDTATERCSVALRVAGRVIARSLDTPRGHADLILPMIEEVLAEGGMRLAELDGIAYGRGPGAFTGVRIAIGVVQGLAFGAQLPTVGVSNLAAVAQQFAGSPRKRILACMDARMSEVYWATFIMDDLGHHVVADGPEHVGPAEAVAAGLSQVHVMAGTGLRAFPELAALYPGVPVHPDALPRAEEIAFLGELLLRSGEGRAAAEAQPVYLRNQVAVAKKRPD